MVDLNPLHYINKFNHMFGDSIASGLEFLGLTDPAVDPDGVREIAKKWRHLASGLDNASDAANRALADVVWEGKTAKAFHKRAKQTRKQATEMAHSLREGADALDQFADQAHELLSEIGVILAEIAEFEIAGLALSILTAGASEVASTLMAGERALKVVALVGRIEEEGTALGTAIRTVTEAIRGIERALKALKEIKSVAAAGRMAKQGMEFSAFATALEDPAAFKDPGKLAGILTEGAVLGVGFGVLGKALGKGLKALKPAQLAELAKMFKLDCAAFERLSLRPGFDELPASIRNTIKKFVRDPIDTATGDMALPRTDTHLPGVLPLVLERTHISSYRWGGWFGPTWASTLDQRLQADDEGIIYATADGARLCFPTPDPATNTPVRPWTSGSRLTLAWDESTDGALRITDPDTGLTHVFHNPVPAADNTAVDLPLQHIQDRNGNRITIEYAEGDIPNTVVHSGGYRIALDHNPARSRITRLRLLDPATPDAPGTTLITFTYNEAGHLAEETNSSGLPLSYTYDTDGRITSWTDRNHTTYHYTYDDHGRVVATTGTGNTLTSTLTYDTATRTTHVTDSLGHTRTYEHNNALRLTRETDPLGNVTRQEWDAELRLTASTNALGHTTRYSYDQAGNVTSVVLPDGATSTAEYNDLHLPVRVTEPNRATWVHEYDAQGNPLTTRDPMGAETRYRYNRLGHLVEVTDALGNSRRITNNRAGLPLRITDALGHTTRVARDAFGRIVEAVDPLDRAVRLAWTVEGRPALRQNPDGTRETWSWDADGKLLSHTDANGSSTSYSRAPFGLADTRTDPGGAPHTFTYDTELRLTQVTSPAGLSWDYTYDAAGRLVAETDFDGRTLTYGYDDADQLAVRTNGMGQAIHYTRDPRGRVTQQRGDAGEITTFAYDPSGHLVRAANADAEVTFERDRTGRTTAEDVNGRTTHYSYDPLGRCVRRTTPAGHTSTWSYNSQGLPAELVTGAGSLAFAYDAAGRETSRRLGEGTTLTQAWDAADRLTEQRVTQIAAGAERLVHSRGYTHRPDGYVTEINDLVAGPSRFALDSAGRITTVDADNWRETYAYDSTGRLTHSALPDTPNPQQHDYTGNQLRRSGRTTFHYDAEGRVVRSSRKLLDGRRRTWTYEWNTDNRLSRATSPEGVNWRYQYDPLGRRTAKQRLSDDGVIADEVRFTWDGSRVAEQTGPDGTVTTWDYAPDSHRPLAQTDRAAQQTTDSPCGGAPRFHAVLTDTVGAPTHLIGPDGNIAWSSRATLWGMSVAAPTASERPVDCPLRFPGQYHDTETGLHYNCQRYYAPETGRYLSPDPLGLEAGPDHYAYVPNPMSFLDPLGLQCTEGGPAEITVQWLEGMPKQQFKMKANALQKLSDAGVLFKAPNPVARDASITNNYKRDLIRRVFDQYGKSNRDFAEALRSRIVQRMNPDHVWELQLGGPDAATNLHILDAFTNQRIGNQIWTQIRSLPDHTPLRIRIEGPE
ncbi:RHS repeat-associated core domain containing protein-containing protein [Actinobacteria bacterium OK074]|nr:RHS repeat-associated core domain containing protein-containing protein [Actinobacteria bacterium OK074]